MSNYNVSRPLRAETLENMEAGSQQYTSSVKRSALSICKAVIKVSPSSAPSVYSSHKNYKVCSFAGGLRVLRTDTEARLPRARIVNFMT